MAERIFLFDHQAKRKPRFLQSFRGFRVGKFSKWAGRIRPLRCYDASMALWLGLNDMSELIQCAMPVCFPNFT